MRVSNRIQLLTEIDLVLSGECLELRNLHPFTERRFGEELLARLYKRLTFRFAN